MNSLEVFETFLVAEALGLMLFVIIKLWYCDVFLQKSTLTKRVEAFLKYGLLKKTLVFTFIYISATLVRYLVLIKGEPGVVTSLLSICGSLSMIWLSYVLFKISSKTYWIWHNELKK